MRKRFQPKTITSTEFELDLAPLLSVMVKLVPVLLISSSFVQMSVVETDVPQVVKEAIQKQENDKTLAQIQIGVSLAKGFQITVAKNGTETTAQVPLLADHSLDYSGLQKNLQSIKSENPKVFSLELAPSSEVSYQDIVKVMDEVRKSKDPQVKFPLHDDKTSRDLMTDDMFPDVTFANMMEG